MKARSTSAIAPPPTHIRGFSDLLRLLPYLKPYRVRWIAMVTAAIVSLVATVAIPLMTKSVIDGPVRHRDLHGLWVLGLAVLAVGVGEAVLWFVRRWLVSRATVGVEADIRKDLYAQLQILPMSFHSRWQSGQLLSRIMNDLGTIRRLLSFGVVLLVLNALDGVDLRRLAQRDLRRHVVMLTQENFLFSGTVADNIRFGRPDATDEEIRAAAVAVGADGFISALPHGYQTDVARRGGRLSAGQRQLVAFARAFLADPAVLILDEATSSLDIPTERLVQDAMQAVLAQRTALIIAHRLSTVASADRVLVLEHGRVVEDGPPAALIRADGHYAALHRAWVDSLA